MNKVKLRRFIARHFTGFVYFAYYMKYKLINFDNNSPIIVLTPGKVGSSSVYISLKKRIDNPVFHVHYISEKGIRESRLEHLKSDRKSIPLHLIVSNLLRKKLNNFDGQIFIITIVREPVSRAISAFFQNTEFYKNSIESKKIDIDTAKSIELLEKIIDKDICKNLEKWFEWEIQKNFGIDIFQYTFDYEKNYKIFRNRRVNLLLMKMEFMDKIFTKAIKELLNINSSVSLIKSNIGENKYYSDSYLKVKKVFKIDDQILENIISSKYFQYFYSDYEKELKTKWSKKKDIL